jgi:hypothetical protein
MRTRTEGSNTAPERKEVSIQRTTLKSHSSFCTHRPVRARRKASYRETPLVKGPEEITGLMVPDISLLFSSPPRNGSNSVRRWAESIRHRPVHPCIYPNTLRLSSRANLLKGVGSPVTTLVSAIATPETVLEWVQKKQPC